MDKEKEEKATPAKLEEGIVHQTTDYGMFKYIESNRTINKNHVQHLIMSFEKNPDLVKTRPILVNQDMQIIDGQHRLQACSTLHIPVYFMIASGTNVESAQLMNALQRGWTVLDFARSYALDRTTPDRAKIYNTFLALHEEYNFPASVLMYFCEGRIRHNVGKHFKQGMLTLPDERVTRLWLDEAEEIREKVGKNAYQTGNYKFLAALFSIFKSPKYDHDRMVKKLDEVQLKPQFNRIDYLRELENIYNNKVQNSENIVRFFG